MSKKSRQARTRADIRHHNGAPTLFINGSPHSAFSYMTYNPQQDYFADFGRAGVNLHSFAANADSLRLWGMKEVWIGPQKFDYSGEDRMFEMIIEAVPDAMIFPRVHTICPRWWVETHPDELVSYVDDSGERKFSEWHNMRFPSWASEPAMAISREAIKRYVEHVRSARYADHVMGYMICSWSVGEWMAFDVDSSRPMTERFRSFLKKKYRDNGRLREAWDDPEVGFDSAEVPREPQPHIRASQSFYRTPSEQPFIDYWENYADVVSDALLGLTRTAKEACDGESVIGAFYGYLLQFGPLANFHGHLALRRVLESPSVDFLSSPSCYHTRSLRNGYSYFMSLPETVKLHGKMWWDENDYRTYLFSLKKSVSAEELALWSEKKRKQHFRRLRRARVVGFNESLEESISYQQREVANCLGDAAGMWWFDMGAGWFAEPRFMEAIAKMNRVAGRSVAFDRSEAAEIGVVLDAWSLPHSHVNSHSTYYSTVEQVPLLGRIGAPVAFYLLEDIDRAPDHKLWIFLNCFAPSKERQKAIREKVRRNGQVAVWLYAPGIVSDGELDAKAASRLCGITLKMRDEESPFAVAVTEAAHPVTMGLFETLYGAPGSQAGRVRDLKWRGERIPWNKDNEWTALYQRTLCRPTLYAADNKAQVLGYLAGLAEPGLVVKSFDEWTSVFSSAGPLPPQLLRNLARLAGAHLYVETDDVVYANKSFMSISTNSGGPRTIRLPRVCDVVEVFSDEIVARQAREFAMELPPATTKLFYLGKADRWFAR